MADVFCPHCGKILPGHANPLPTVDVVIRHPKKGIVLVRRRFPPLGWALPGGFVDYGEAVEAAAVREALDETGLVVRLTKLVVVYSDPARDARKHTISTVFAAEAENPEAIAGGDDAAEARFFLIDDLPPDMAFDHGVIIQDYLRSGTKNVSG